MSSIDLYYMPMSAPCRSVLMLAKHLNIDLNLNLINLYAGDHLKPEFVKINPHHCVPTIVDDGFALWESRAILQYLANKHNSELYPSEPKARAIVDRLLYFDLETLYKSIGEYFYPQIWKKEPASEAKFKSFKESVSKFEAILEGKEYVAGNQLTIADLSIYASLTLPLYLLDYDYSEWKNVSEWLARLANELPYNQEINVKPNEEAKEMIKQNK